MTQDVADKVYSQSCEALTRKWMIGFCLNCGQKSEGIKPDAEGYECQNCGDACVSGSRGIVMIGGGWLADP